MTVRIWNKTDTQATIKRLREAGYIVAKSPAGTYRIVDDIINNKEWMHEDGKPLFRAMIGNNGYLVNFHSDLMS